MTDKGKEKKCWFQSMIGKRFVERDTDSHQLKRADLSYLGLKLQKRKEKKFFCPIF